MDIIEVRFLGNVAILDIDGNKHDVNFFTKDMNSHILDCKLDLFEVIESSKVKEIIDIKYKEKLNDDRYDSTYGKKLGIIYGDTLKVKVDIDGKIISIYDLDPYVKTGTIDEVLKELYNINKRFISTIKYCENNPVSLNNQIFYAGYEAFNKFKRVLEHISLQVENPRFKKLVSSFINKNNDEIEYIEDVFVNMASNMARCCMENDFGLKNHRLLNSKVYRLKNHRLFFDKMNNLLCELFKVLEIDIKRVKYPEIKGKLVKISSKEMKKSNVKAHIRKTKMTKSKKEKVLCFLEEHNLNIDGIGIITKDNFNTFDWTKMTIVDEFEKNIKGIKHQDNKDIDKYIDKEIEKQKKLDNANLIHQKLVRQMAYCIDENGFEPKYNKFIDLYFEEDEKCMIFEMKSINESNCYSQLMKAYSQLMAYPYICNIKNKVDKCIVLNQKPIERRFEELFKDSNINLIWLENDSFNTYEWSNDNVIKLLLKQVTIIE
ncbi:Uncharacterised protein [uncultured Clostridium sp.]|nr:Uncharacterised protein [uncultured Clostridium sp.]